MKIWVLSDLHESLAGSRFRLAMPPVHDVLVLAGDIAWSPVSAIQIAATLTNRPIILVSGNHEFYRRDWVHTLTEMQDAANTVERLHLLENRAVTFGSVRFLGCTLWTDFNLHGTAAFDMRICSRSIMDFYEIRHAGALLTPADQLARHQASAAWLTAELAKPFAGKTIVVTHHAPHRGSQHVKYEGDSVSAGFVSHRPDLVSKADFWIHGHVHDAFDYQAEGCRIVCNPRGYGHEWGHNGFKPDLVIEV